MAKSFQFCDELLEHPLLATPPPEPEKPKPPYVHVRKVYRIDDSKRFPLLDSDFFKEWCEHRKNVENMKPKVDDKPPMLFPELYLKPRRLNVYAKQLEENMTINKDLLKKINNIQRSGGFVKCWREEQNNRLSKLLCSRRQNVLDKIRRDNLQIYKAILHAKSDHPRNEELAKFWEYAKKKLVANATHPFILFRTERIDAHMRDPAFDKPPGANRTRVVMDLAVKHGSMIGRVVVELFDDIVPRTCQLFMMLLSGDAHGHAYTGTKIFRIVPGLYCCFGDVTKNNGFGCYLPEGAFEPIGAENYDLTHSMPGVMSMVVTSSNEVCGHFNLTFKPLPQFNRRHVVFGRVVGGPAQVVDRISAQGLPLGTPQTDIVIRHCGHYDESGEFHKGARNTIKFPEPRRH